MSLHITRDPVRVQDAVQRSPVDQRSVVLLNLVAGQFGGLETHVLALHATLSASSCRPLTLAPRGSEFHRRCVKQGMVVHAVRGCSMPGFRLLISPLLRLVTWRCGAVAAIHCNNRYEVPPAVNAARRSGARVILNYHVPSRFDTESLRGAYAFVASNPDIVEVVRHENEAQGLGLSVIEWIPPLFDAVRLRTFRTDLDRNAWYANHFGVKLRPCPVVCTIGNMVSDLEHKNYPLLFRSLAILIHRRGVHVQLAIAGDGPVRDHLVRLAGELGVLDYIHFLGRTADTTPGVLHHSDVFVLASSKEAFGIAFLEAGLMRRPAIGARNTGAESILQHGRTGLLFENGDADSLATAILQLISSREAACRMGANAREHVEKHFAPEVVAERYKALYFAENDDVRMVAGKGCRLSSLPRVKPGA